MEITTKSAFWILDHHQRIGTRLDVGGMIIGETACAGAVVTDVRVEEQSVSIRLFSRPESITWDRVIPLRGATFFYVRIEDSEMARFIGTGWYSVLRADFSDGTVLFFADKGV